MDPLLRALDAPGPWFAETTLGSVILSLLLAFVLGQALAWVYVWSHSGLSYARSFTQALVLMTLVTSLVMMVIGNSIVTAFGLLGALALIRFRNVLKDTRDTVFVFTALVVGMAVGSQRYGIAALGTVAIGLVVLYLNATSFGSQGRFDGYLTLRLTTTGAASQASSRMLQRFCRRVKAVSTRQTGDEPGAELVYQVGLRDRERGHELIAGLREIEGVEHASLVLRDELSEV